MRPSIRGRLRYTLQRCLNLQGRRPGRRGGTPRKERVVAEGNGPAQDETAGIREEPVTGIERNGGSVVVTLAGELDLYNAHALPEALLARCCAGSERLIVDL